MRKLYPLKKRRTAWLLFPVFMLLFSTHINAQSGMVGSLGGEVSVSPLGTATYSIPIEVPPSTHGMQPGLSVTYNSAMGRGLLGTGWTLSGLSSITRIPRTPYYDSVTGSVNFDGNDRLALDGERLIRLGGSPYMANGAVYGTETENFLRVTLTDTPSAQYSPFFTAVDAQGYIMEYGNSDNSKQRLGTNKILSWLLNKVTDPDGNYMVFFYEVIDSTRENRIKCIDFTGNQNTGLTSFASIRFDYIADPNANKVYVSNEWMWTASLLSAIRVTYNNNLVRKYEFEYDFDRSSRLTDVILKDGDGHELTRTSVKWNNDDAYGTCRTIGGLSSKMMVVGDFNKDNRQDLFVYDSQGKKREWYVKEGDGTGQFGSATCSGTAWGYAKFFSVDMEGDGKDEVAYIVQDTVQEDLFYLNLIRFSQGVSFTDSLGTNNTNAFLLGNFDGTGRMTVARVGVPSGGNKTVTIDSLNMSITVGGNHKVMVTDLNGNGKSDFLVMRNPRLDVYEYDEVLDSMVKICDSHWFPYSPTRTCFGDFNGDGNMDLVFYYYDSGEGHWCLKLSKGNGYTVVKSLPFEASYNNAGEPMFPLIISDVNGDGKDDAIQPVGYGTQVTLNVYYSRGCDDNGFRYEMTPYQFGVFTNPIGDYYLFADMNADGKNELIHKSSVVAPYAAVVGLREQRDHDLPVSFTDGFGKETTLEFLYCNSPLSGSAGGEGRRFHYPLVSRVITPDGTGGSTVTAHAYHDLVFDYTRRQILGFELMQTRRDGTNTRLMYKLNESRHYLALEQSQVYYLPSGPGEPTGYVADSAYWAVNHNVLKHRETYNTPACLSLEYGRYVPYNAVSSDINRLDNTVVTSSVWLDSAGRVEKTSSVHKKAKTENGTCPWLERDSTVYTYTTVSLPNGATAVKPSNTRVWHRRNGFPQTPYTNTAVAYDINGRAATVTVSDSDGPVGVTSYTYNSLGLPLTETLTPSGMTARTRSFSYDSKGRFLTGETDALGHTTSATYDPPTGRKLTETDVNNLTTHYLYDAFGRVTRVTRPDGTLHNTAYGWNTLTAFPDAVWYSTESEAGKPTTRTYHDILGRAVHSFVEGCGFNDVVHDSLGRVAMETVAPYESPSTASSAKAWRHYTRDVYGRVTAETAPYTDISYSYFSPDSASHHDYFVSAYDNIRDVKTERVYDVMGRLKSVDDDGGLVGYAYAYQTVDGSTRDVTTVTLGGVTTTVVSDIRGNRLSIQDPDAGAVTSEYDALNQLRVRTDANGVSEEYTYDLAGRVTRVVYSKGNKSDIVTYTYDTAPGKGVGKPASVAHGGDMERRYVYDNLGRLAYDIAVDGVTEYDHHYQYDSLGRLQYLTYPDGFVVKYGYDDLGRLGRVSDVNAHNFIYAVDSRDRFGHPLKCRLGNGAGTQYTYNQLGMLTGIRDGVVDYHDIIVQGDEEKYYDIGSQYRNLAYAYDTRGFIQSRTDSTAMQCETYAYDKLDRLSSYTVNGTQTLAFGYGANGNITFNPKAGTYSYGSSRPHAVSQVSGIPANASPLPSQCDVTYNLMNRPESLSGGGYSVGLDYDANGVRRHTSVTHYNSPVREKTRLSSLFETEETPTAYRRIDYVYAEGRVVAARVYENGSGSLYYVLTDHLGSWERVLDGNRNTVQQTHFDPWGNRMDFNAWATPQTQTSFLFDRGFTGHEHYDFLRVINANARLYDPVIGRFFSPDPFVQAPDFSQNYNRYSYCMNNPVMYSDPDGESILAISMIVGAIVCSYIGGTAANGWNYNPCSWTWDGKTWASIGIGAMAGTLAGAAFAYLAPSLASTALMAHFGASGTMTSFALTGFVTLGTGGYVSGFSGGMFYSDGDINYSRLSGFQGFKVGATMGALAGQLAGGIVSYEPPQKKSSTITIKLEDKWKGNYFQGSEQEARQILIDMSKFFKTETAMWYTSRGYYFEPICSDMSYTFRWGTYCCDENGLPYYKLTDFNIPIGPSTNSINKTYLFSQLDLIDGGLYLYPTEGPVSKVYYRAHVHPSNGEQSNADNVFSYLFGIPCRVYGWNGSVYYYGGPNYWH